MIGKMLFPSNPRAWLISTGRFKAIDRMRRQSKFDPLQEKQVRRMEADIADPSTQVDKKIEDDILRLGRGGSSWEIRPAADLTGMVEESERRRKR